MTRRLLALAAVIGVIRLIAGSVHSEHRLATLPQSPSQEDMSSLVENAPPQAPPLPAFWIGIATEAEEAGPAGPASEIE